MDMETRDQRPTNDHVIKTVNKLIEWLKKEKQTLQSAPHLSHYREIPSDVATAYTLLTEGAQLIHGTATKYTLVGKINGEEQKKLGYDLERGCELVGAATHVFLQDKAGCSVAVRHSTQKASLQIFINVLHLAESFQDGSALDENVGAQRTGAVWESCDTVIKKLLPQGNRNAIRRELFTWTRECQDTMEEFQEMIDLGPTDKAEDDAVEDEMDDLFGDGEQYSETELPIAKACLGLLKNSRGNMKASLEACEGLGTKGSESGDETYFDQIAQVHEYARAVGEGVTDFGSLMYPPILPSTSDLEAQVNKQVEAIKTLQDYILGLDQLPKNTWELANVLRNAAETRHKEFIESIIKAKK